MGPVPRHQLFTRSGSSESHYAIVFAVLGSVIVIGGVLWGYFLPKWREKRRRPVQTRYNCIAITTNHQRHSEHGLELPIIFPPHPAVVVPLNKRRGSRSHVHYSSSIPVYDPRTHSPFPNALRAGSCRQWTSDVSIKPSTAVSACKMINRHDAKLQRAQAPPSTNSAHGQALPRPRSMSTTNAKVSCSPEDNSKRGRRSLLVARSAGAPPVNSKAGKLVSDKSRYKIPSRKASATFSASISSAVGAPDHQNLPKVNESHQLNSSHCPSAEKVDGMLTKARTLNAVEKPVSTPSQNVFGFRNIFETPSSPGTVTTTRFGSSTNRAHYDSTPPTGPNSSALQPRGGIDSFPGISKLVPSRRFKSHLATTGPRQIQCTDDGSEANLRLSSEEAHGLRHMRRNYHRPVSGIWTECSGEE
jgi:hypothetical protein